MKRTSYIYMFDTEKSALTRDWSSLSVKKSAWKGSCLRAFFPGLCR